MVDFPLQMLAFLGAGGEPPRRKRLLGSHLSRSSRRNLALPLQSTLNSFVLKTNTPTTNIDYGCDLLDGPENLSFEE
ncbi:hypothetical protein [Peribacillus sp. AS_2]|uniref:hypothetical protein n=1 Tax=Peribacillus sp. AS_2 TaxID=2996755 RepID=UPI0022A664D4|nr:hypothetical protein [Peribacillus sp. AS_2]MCZ0874676.1 hypothetical protein [Peribacillus sp. AS_2]